MAPASTEAHDSSSLSTTADKNLQPFFVLHKGSPPEETHHRSEKKPTRTVRTRRQLDMSPPSPKSGEHLDFKTTLAIDEQFNVNMRTDAFEAVWSKMDSSINDVLRNINSNVFNDIHQWVCDSFNTITSSTLPTLSESTRSFPLVRDATSKQLFTGVVLTTNMEFVDDLSTFKELGLHLKSQGCHVANISSVDISAKNGIGGCLRSLLRQFLTLNLDAADISILATWYREQGSCTSPLVIIIDDMEQCCGSILSDFILMLSEWVLKIPIVLIMGVSTTPHALRSMLPSNVLQHLCPCKFMLPTPSERMDAVLEAVLLKQHLAFNISHKVAVFMRNNFLIQDGTVTSFVKALKIACALFFCSETSSLLHLRTLLEEAAEVSLSEKFGTLTESLLKHAFDLPSCGRNRIANRNGETLVQELSDLKKLRGQWSAVLMCVYEAAKFDRIRLLDIFCEAIDPSFDKSGISISHRGLQKDSRASPSDRYTSQGCANLQKGGFFYRAIRKVRDLPPVQLHKLIEGWKKHTVDYPKIHGKVKELLLSLKFDDGKSLKKDPVNTLKRYASRSNLIEKDSKAANEGALKLIDWMVREYMLPTECIAFHEIGRFKKVDELQMALIGDPRRRIQVDLLESQTILQCSCCSISGSALLESMHDSSIMYKLAQEHVHLINLHDWYQSFKSVVLSTTNKGKKKSKYSPSPKKRKVANVLAKPSEASIQARFCRAVTELQIAGLLRMPSRRRPDFVQRVAFGL